VLGLPASELVDLTIGADALWDRRAPSKRSLVDAVGAGANGSFCRGGKRSLGTVAGREPAPSRHRARLVHAARPSPMSGGPAGAPDVERGTAIGLQRQAKARGVRHA
jgi:hypothetical protein